jgi:hypothetical protein
MTRDCAAARASGLSPASIPSCRSASNRGWELVGAGELEPPAVRHQHAAEAPPRASIAACATASSVAVRERLAEHGCDAVEAALHAGLATAESERLGVSQREDASPANASSRLASRGSNGSPPSGGRGPLHFAAPLHRRDDGVGELFVRGVWYRFGELAVLTADHRAALPIARPASPRVAPNSKPTSEESNPRTAAQRSVRARCRRGSNRMRPPGAGG